MNTTVSIAITGMIALGTLELAEVVEAKALAYNEAVKAQAQCYKARDFKCLAAREKFKEVAEGVK